MTGAHTMNNGGFQFGDVAGDVKMHAGGDIVAGNKTVIQNIIRQAQKVVTAPYKFLASYDISDRDIFFGRTAVIEELAGKIPRHKALIINGRSGSGKTSLLNAGLIPRLAENDYVYVSFREYSDPIRQFQEHLARDDRLKHVGEGAWSLVELLQAVPRQQENRLVVVFDQFERFFVNVSPAKRARFIEEFRECMNSRLSAGEMNVVFSLREDFFGAFVIEFEKIMPQFFNESAHFNLHPLNREEAREAIVRPLKHVPNIGYNMPFVDELLLPGLIGEGSGHDQIDPPHLQIVCNQLYKMVRERYAADLEMGGVVQIDRPLYEDLGQTKGILRTYLDDFIDRIAHRDSGGRDVLRSMLKLMIETTGTRKFVSFPDMQSGLPDVSQTRIEGYVRQLQDGRVIETLGQDEAARYSLSHEVMVQKVQSWFDERELQRKKAQETLERGLAEWKRTQSLLNEKQVVHIRTWLSGDTLKEDGEQLLTKSQQAYEEGKRKEAEQARRSKKLRQIIQIGTVVFVLVAGILAFWNWQNAEKAKRQAEIAQQEKENAERQKERAEKEQKTSRSRELAALAMTVVETDPTLSFRLAEAALQVEPTRLAQKALFLPLPYPFHNILQGHTKGVVSAAFSPDGTRIVTASRDGTAQIWNAATGEELHRLVHKGVVMSAVFSPDGTQIVTASEDPTARIWNVATGEELYQLTGHTDAVWSAAFSPDGKKIVTASEDGTARIWDTVTGEELHQLIKRPGPVSYANAAFSPDGTRLITVSDDEVRVRDATTYKKLQGEIMDGVESAAFSPDGNRIVTAFEDGTVKIWDAVTGKPPQRLTGHTTKVWDAVFSPDGSRIVTTSFDNTVRLWNVFTGKELQQLIGHTSFVMNAVFSPDSTRIVTASMDGTAGIWDVVPGEGFYHLIGHTTGWVWDATFSPDGNRIVTASGDHTARIWDATTGEELHRLVHKGVVVSAAFSPDGTQIVTATADPTARLWDAATGEKLHQLEHEDTVSDAVFSPDGTRIVTGSEDKTARIWDTVTGEELHQLTGHTERVTSVAFSPDGTRIVTASMDGTAGIWDVVTGEKLQRLIGPSGFRSAAFSPDGTRISTISANRGVWIWNAATGEELQSLTGHTGLLRSAVFSPDGTRIVTASWDNTARIWDVVTGEELYRLTHTDRISSAVFSPAGTRIVTASRDGTARIWPTTWQEALRLINEEKVRGAVRQLTEEEKKRYELTD